MSASSRANTSWFSHRGDESASADDPADGIHTDFRLGAYQEDLVLSDARGLYLDGVHIDEIGADMSYARTLDDQGSYQDAFEIVSKPSPGFANTEEGYQSYLADNQIALGQIIINEVMLSNAQYAQASDGNYYDWIEVYNRGTAAVNLEGYALTTNLKNPAYWRFGNVSIDPGEYLMVQASGLDEYIPGREVQEVKKNDIHTNFKLSMSGEVLALYDNTDTLIDRYNIDYLPQNVSYGRQNDDSGFYYFTTPTPGAQNSGGKSGYLKTPQLLLSPGMYEGTQSLTINAEEGTQVYYTLDGSVPTQNATRYTGAISIDATTIVRAAAYREGYLPSAVKTGTYLIDDAHTLPIVSLVAEPNDLWSASSGIYAMGGNVTSGYPTYTGANFKQDWERTASIEIMETGKTAFSQDVVIRIFGQYSRGEVQKSIAVFADSAVGPSTMQYPIFDDLPYEEYDSIVLRQAGNDCRYAKMRDVAMTSVFAENTDVDVQAYKPCVLYLNGKYWGIYYIREKINESYVEQHYGIENAKENIDMIQSQTMVKTGALDDYQELVDYMRAHDLNDSEAYEYVQARMDVQNYMDYIIAVLYYCQTDPGQHQVLQAERRRDMAVDTVRFRLGDVAGQPDGQLGRAGAFGRQL